VYGGSGSGGGRGAALRDQPSDTVPHWHTVLLRFQVRTAGKGGVAAVEACTSRALFCA